MKKSRYEPKFIDTRVVEIPKELEVLTETLARNTHEVWAENETDYLRSAMSMAG